MYLLDMLPLLEGWDDISLVWAGTITSEPQRVIEREVRVGWLQHILVITDDLYGGFEVEYNRTKSGYATPAEFYLYGYDAHAPRVGFFLRKYNNTGPGTYGVYVTQGMFWEYPVKGHTAADVKLGALSSFSSATIAIGVSLFEITHLDSFKGSLRKLFAELGLSKGGGK